MVVVFDIIFKKALILGDLMLMDSGQQPFAT